MLKQANRLFCLSGWSPRIASRPRQSCSCQGEPERALPGRGQEVALLEISRSREILGWWNAFVRTEQLFVWFQKWCSICLQVFRFTFLVCEMSLAHCHEWISWYFVGRRIIFAIVRNQLAYCVSYIRLCDRISNDWFFVCILAVVKLFHPCREINRSGDSFSSQF